MWAQQLIYKLVVVDIEKWNPYVVMDLLYTLASKTDRFDITIKWRT